MSDVLRNVVRGAVRAGGPAGLTFIVATVAAEVLIRTLGISPLVLPTPGEVMNAAWAGRADLVPALVRTTEAVLIGLAMSGVVGVAGAVVLSMSRWVERALYPYALFFQVVPIVAIAPLLVIWFGYGMRAVVASAFIVSVFPVVASTLSGLVSVDPNLKDLMRVYGAGPVAMLWKLKLPSALPEMFTGLRIAAGLAVIGAIVGEFVGGGGLGVIVLSAIRQQRTDIVFAAVLYASGLGLVLFGGIGIAGRITLRHWHASARGPGS